MTATQTQEHSIYDEIEALVSHMKEQRLMPGTEEPVYANIPLYENMGDEPRYEADIIIKKLF